MLSANNIVGTLDKSVELSMQVGDTLTMKFYTSSGWGRTYYLIVSLVS